VKRGALARTLLSSVDYRLAFHRLFKGCSGSASFAVDNIIVLSLDACDCTPGEVLFQIVDNSRDFTDLKRGISRGWVDVKWYEPRAF
jgi:hypothetical protein